MNMQYMFGGVITSYNDQNSLQIGKG
jgi:hypothetical protein